MDQSPATAIVLVLTTLSEGADAVSFAQTLVTERLAACVNVLPVMHSVYRWKGAVESVREQQLVIKTTAELVDVVKARVLELHPYDVPELLVVPVSGGAKSYLSWLRESVG